MERHLHTYREVLVSYEDGSIYVARVCTCGYATVRQVLPSDSALPLVSNDDHIAPQAISA